MEFVRLVQARKYQSKDSNPGKLAPDHWRVCWGHFLGEAAYWMKVTFPERMQL